MRLGRFLAEHLAEPKWTSESKSSLFGHSGPTLWRCCFKNFQLLFNFLGVPARLIFREIKGRLPLRKNLWDRNKIEAWAFGTNFLFQFKPVIRNLDDKELKYFQLFWSGGVDNTRWKKVRFDAYFPEWKLALKPVFHLGEFVRTNRERSNLIGW